KNLSLLHTGLACGSSFESLVCFFFQAEDGIRDFSRDWSSDVCSSDLDQPPAPEPEAQGRPDATAGGFALGAAVAGLDNPNFTYGYYVDQMLAKISSNWTRPLVGSGVEAVLHFVIQRDGRITQLRVVNSSGLDSFDLAALRAVQTSSPLPPLPRAFREETLGVNLIVR